MHHTSNLLLFLTCPHFTCQQEMKLHWDCRETQRRIVPVIALMLHTDQNPQRRPTGQELLLQRQHLVHPAASEATIKRSPSSTSRSVTVASAARQPPTVSSLEFKKLCLTALTPAANMLLVSEKKQQQILAPLLRIYHPQSLRNCHE